MNETKYWVWLTSVFGIASRRIWEAMKFFPSAREAYEMLKGGETALRLSEKETEKLRSTDISFAERVIETSAEKGINVIGYSDSLYPPQLRYIANPPAALYYRGNISCLKGTRSAAAVGTRRASAYGLSVTSRICGELASKGIVIISGFAVGIDITAQLAAADAGRPSACVLGCGVDVDYPRENMRYREHILETGGVFVSEYPPGTTPHPGNFPTRNRILAALGRVALVFEASAKSGSLITASLASDQGREIFCLPPADIMSNAYSGNVQLLRQGASLLLSAQDVLDCFRIGGANDSEIRRDLSPSDAAPSILVTPERQRELREDMLARMNVTQGLSESAAQPKTAKAAAGKKAAEPDLSGLEGIQLDIAKLMLGGAVHADVIAQKCGLDAASLMAELTELEITGLIRSLPGKMFELVQGES